VQFILRHERQHLLRFAALESEMGRQIRARHPELASADTMIWVDHPGAASERVHARSAAAMRIGRYMGGIWSIAATLGTILPRPIRDAAYDFVARHRHRLLHASAQCYLPPVSARGRFLDQPAP
jgi:predicted DCC family thiol-disulfide oxidoreductase YuxK